MSCLTSVDDTGSDDNHAVLIKHHMQPFGTDIVYIFELALLLSGFRITLKNLKHFGFHARPKEN